MTTDEKYMYRAFELARLGIGHVSPNPLVGCVVVHNDRVIAEGWHQRFGGPHAEVNAINSLKRTELLKESTVYVTLEPCSHHGKTPPCADLLVEKNVKKVVIANEDPNPLVSGRGIKKLRDHGIEVIENVLADVGKEVNCRFFTGMTKARPYIILKWAQTSDGFIARKNYDSKWISSDLSRKLVHKWRSEEDAILVGKNTALYDNPRLNVRDWSGKSPVRVVIDHDLRLTNDLNLFDQSQQTLVYNLLRNGEEDKLKHIKLGKDNFLKQVLDDLAERKLHSLIVEGGSQTFNLFIQKNLWDEARVFVSPTKFVDGIKAPELKTDLISSEEIINDDRLFIYKNF